MLKKFEVYLTKMKGGCHSDTKAAPQESWNDLTLIYYSEYRYTVLANKLFNETKKDR